MGFDDLCIQTAQMRDCKSLILRMLVRSDLIGVSNIAFGSDLSDVQAAGVSKHVGCNCGVEIVRKRCYSLFSYVIAKVINMSLDRRHDTRHTDWEPQSRR
jgi:hypothetical protein